MSWNLRPPAWIKKDYPFSNLGTNTRSYKNKLLFESDLSRFGWDDQEVSFFIDRDYLETEVFFI